MPAFLPITVIVAAKNEEKNIAKCLRSLTRAIRVIVADSRSSDRTAAVADGLGASVLQFTYTGAYPKKRQWVLDNGEVDTEWILLIDADEVVPDELWLEIERELPGATADAYIIRKEFHFLGRRFRFGGFSHSAVLLFRRGRARFESLFDDVDSGLDMEVHERLMVTGRVGVLKTPLVHEDFKGLSAYIDRHNRYSTWESQLRSGYLEGNAYGERTIRSSLFGDIQERRRFLKLLVMRMPFEPWIWFFYHFFVRLGFLEGRRGLIACQIRANYIRDVRAKIYERTLALQR